VQLHFSKELPEFRGLPNRGHNTQATTKPDQHIGSFFDRSTGIF